MDIGWTDERVLALKAMAEDGISAPVMAAELGVSRNAVIGKIHRMKLAWNWESREVWSPAPEEKPAVVIDGLNLTLLELEPGHCRFPLGDPGNADFRFCGNERFGQHPYCIGHCRIAYRPLKERQAHYHAS